MHSQIPPKRERENERRRSLCDGGGALCVWQNVGKVAARSENVRKYRRHKSAKSRKRIADSVWAAAAMKR
jgi:hypothetical protein